MKPLIIPYTLYGYDLNEDGSIDVSSYFSDIVYARTEEDAEKIYLKENSNVYIDNIEPKEDITYNDLYRIIQKMTKKQREQQVIGINDDNLFYIDLPFIRDDRIVLELYDDTF